MGSAISPTRARHPSESSPAKQKIQREYPSEVFPLPLCAPLLRFFLVLQDRLFQHGQHLAECEVEAFGARAAFR
jgi:hypothetical protein